MKRFMSLLFVLAGCSGASQNPATVPPSPAKPAPVVEAPKVPAVKEAPKETPKQEAKKNPDLLVHLKFDDGGHDASGFHHAAVIQGKVSWADGKAGKAAAFDGSGAHIELPSADDLDKLNEGSYTIAAWFKPANAPPGQEEGANDGNYGIINKTGWHEGLHYSNEKKFVMEHWLAGEKPEEPKWTGAGTWEDTFEPGAWYHVVGVVDRAAGEVKLYVNGELKNTGENFGANAKAKDYGKTTWKIGMAAPGSEKWAWPAKGAVSDVRFYKKALTDAEIEALYKEGTK